LTSFIQFAGYNLKIKEHNPRPVITNPMTATAINGYQTKQSFKDVPK